MPLSSLPKKLYSVQFNGALPITIVVLEKTGFRRYRLKVGNKELSTKSLTPLAVGSQYWGDFSYTKDGMLSIGNLKEKPPMLQKESNFLHIGSWELVDSIALRGEGYFHECLLAMLDMTENRAEFQVLSTMLLALNEGVIHLPLMVAKRPFLLQYKTSKNEDLNENLIDFFFAFDTLGAIKGRCINENSIFLETLFAKTKQLMEDNILENMNTKIKLSQTVPPLWVGEDSLLDVKG